MSMSQDAVIRVTLFGKYGGASGMDAFERDMNAMQSKFSRMFVEPFKSISPAIEAESAKASAAIQAQHDKAAAAMAKSSRAKQDAFQLEQRMHSQRLAMAQQLERAQQSAVEATNRAARARTSLSENEQRAQQAAAQAAKTSSVADMQRAQLLEQRVAQQRLQVQDLEARARMANNTVPVMQAGHAQRLGAMQTGLDRAVMNRDMAMQGALDAEAYAKSFEQEKLKALQKYERDAKFQRRMGQVNALSLGAMGVGGLVAGGLLLSGEAAAKYQEQIASVSANTNMMGRERGFLTQSALNVSRLMPASVMQIADAYKIAAEAGYHYASGMQIVRDAIKSAIPTHANLNDVMKVLTGNMIAFGVKADQAGKQARPFLDMLHTAAANAKADLGQFAPSYARVGITAASIDKSPDMMAQSMSLLSALTAAGMPIYQASTQAQGFLNKLLNPTAKTKSFLQELYYQRGINLYGDFTSQGIKARGIGGILQDITDAHLTPEEIGQIFPNMRGSLVPRFLANEQGVGLYNRIYGATKRAPQANQGKGVTDYEYQNYLKTAAAQQKLLTNNIRATEIALGQGLLPAMVAISKFMVPIVQGMSHWAQQHKTITPLILGMSVALFGLGAAAKVTLGFINLFGDLKIVSGVRAIGTAAGETATGLRIMGIATWTALGPFGLLIVAAAALGVGAAILYAKWKPFRDLVNGIGLAVKNLATGAFDLLIRAAQAVIGYFKDNWPKILLTVIMFPFMGPMMLFFSGLPQKFFTWAGNAALGFINGLKAKAADAGKAAQNFLGMVTGWLGFHSPNAYGVDPQVWGTNLGQSFVDGVNSKQGDVKSSSKGYIDTIDNNLGSSDSKSRMYNRGATLGEQIGSGIQDKLNNTTFTANVNTTGSNVGAQSRSGATTTYVVPGSYNSVAAWPVDSGHPGGYGAPGRTYNAGLRSYLSTPFGNFQGATSNRRDDSDATMLHSWGVKTTGTIFDTDYASGYGVKHNVVLPGGSNVKWKLVKSGVDPNTGGYEVWQAPNGGIVTFLHLSSESMPGRKNPYRKGGAALPPIPIPQGAMVAGGTVVGQSGHPLTGAYGNNPGFWHLCVVTDAKGRQYVSYLSSGQMQGLKQSGAKVVELPNTGGAGMPAGVKADWGMIAGAGQQYGVNPFVLAGVATQESGGNPNAPQGMGMPASYAPGKQQIYGSAQTLRNLYDWTGTAAGQASMKAHGLDPKNGYARWEVALAAYNNGTNAWWQSGPRPGESPGQYAHGLGYATNVIKYAQAYGNTPQPTASQHHQQPGPGVNNLPNTGGATVNSDKYGGYPWEYAGTDALGRPIPLPPKDNSASGWSRYWYLRQQIDKQTFSANFGGVNWKMLDSSGASEYMAEQGKVFWDTFQMRNNQVNQWWNGLTPQQRSQKSFQNLHNTALRMNQVSYNQSMGKMKGNFAAQPFYQNAWWEQQDLNNQKDIWAYTTKPWTLSHADQQEWMQGQRRMHWDQAQVWANQAKAFAATHKYVKHIDQWLKDRLGAIWAWQNNANQHSLYQLQHNGQTGATGRAMPVHIIGRCAAEAAANVHRKQTAESSKKAEAHNKKIAENSDHLKKLETIVSLLREIKTQGLNGGSSAKGKAGTSVRRNPHHFGVQAAPSPI